MKIVIATPLYPPEIGGPATYAEILNRELPRQGIEVSLVKFSEVRRYPKLLRHWIYYRRLLNAAHDADCIFALDPVSVGLPALWAARRLKKKFVVKIVGDYAWEQGRQRFGVTQELDDFITKKQKSFFVRRLQRIQTRVATRANNIIVPSEYLKKIIISWNIPSEKIKVIYNAVSLETLGNASEAAKKLPRPLVVTAGRLVPWKNIDRVIDAVWSVRQEGKQLSLVVVGDGPERKKLEAQAALLLTDDFLFTGELSHPDVLATLGVSDIFVLNSSYEGLSHVLIEAMSLGIPSIVTDVGGNSEVVISGGSITIRLNDNIGLVSGLSFLVSNEEQRSYLSASAKKSAKRFSVETMIKETIVLLQTP